MSDPQRVIPLDRLRMTDVERVGGKNASLGELARALGGRLKVPEGFAVTADAYRRFVEGLGRLFWFPMIRLRFHGVARLPKAERIALARPATA